MSHRKRKQLPTSDPEYILSLLEGDSSGESDFDLYSESDDEDLFFSEASPTSSFQSYLSISLSLNHLWSEKPLYPIRLSTNQLFSELPHSSVSSKELSAGLFYHCSGLLAVTTGLVFFSSVPSLVLLLPIHYHHHCVVSVRAAATLGLLML